jgi:hypothetical protein
VIIRKLDKSIINSLLWATSTKSAFYALTVLIIFAVIMSPPSNIQGWLLVIVSEFYQGVALPGLGSAQKAEAEETRKLLQETHDMVITELSVLKEELELIKEEHRELHELMAEQREIMDVIRNLAK